MNAAPTNRAYKVISLLIKAGILILSFWYVFYKLKSTTAQVDFTSVLKQSDLTLLIVTFCLMFVNWGLEALKWKLLIAPLENITFFTAFKSVFAGVTVSIFMPNRIGEFAGRIFFLEKAGKVEATLKNFAGSIVQLCITIIAGVSAFFIFFRSGNKTGVPIAIQPSLIAVFFLMAVIALLLLLNLLYKYRARFSIKIQSYLNAVYNISGKELALIFILSLLRYLVFLFQYYLVLRALHVDVDVVTGGMLIAIVFLITSVIPSFALTEVVTRGAVAVTLFAGVTTNETGVIAASFIVWVINLAIPALAGSLFIGKMKFFKS
ncbi:MAG: hypothetical protein JWP12_2443 [Bacteroidetes bacterium]|nr:hypothetical protein [Bacteroidota bacterium]